MNDRERGSDTRYLPAERTGAAALADEIARAAANPLLDTLLRTTGGALAVVDANRQLVALNPAWLALAGVREPQAVLGARPGEALGCTFSATAPGGCGTCAACASCGLAASLLVAGHRRGAAERDCVIEARQDGKAELRVLRVRAAPLPLDGADFVLLALTDVTEERRRDEVERTFVHDLSNLASGLSGVAAELQPGATAEPAVVEDVVALSEQLVREIRLHRALIDDRPEGFRPALTRAAAADVVRLVHAAAAHGPAADGRTIEVAPVPVELDLVTDPLLVQHVLLNMLVNALEASRPGETVRLVSPRRRAPRSPSASGTAPRCPRRCGPGSSSVTSRRSPASAAV